MFYHICYEGSVNLDDIDDLAKRHALEVQISEFGQIPKQLFQQPHVPRLTGIPSTIELRVDSTSGTEDLMDKRLSIDDGTGLKVTQDVKLDFEYHPHRLTVTCMVFEQETGTIYSTSEDGTLKIFDWRTKRQTRSVNLGTMPISSCVRIPDTEIFVLGCWDNTM